MNGGEESRKRWLLPLTLVLLLLVGIFGGLLLKHFLFRESGEEGTLAAETNRMAEKTESTMENTIAVETSAAEGSSVAAAVETTAVQPAESVLPGGEKEIPEFVLEDTGTPAEESAVRQSTSSGSSAEPIDVESEIEYIRSIYYGVDLHKENFDVYEAADSVTVYESKADHHIQCILADIGTYDSEISQKYAAEYYYDYDASGGSYTLRFVFVHNADYSEEYRIYLTEDQRCIRYIGPYESEETTYDYSPPVSDLETVIPVHEFCGYGLYELHLFGIY